jgi:diguanylate cyclase (GGDEF)-like protein
MKQLWQEADKHLNSANHRIVVVMTCALLISLWGGVGFWSWWERSSTIASNRLVLEQLNNAVQEQTKGLLQQAETSLVVAADWMSKHPDEDPGNAPHFIELIDKLRKVSDHLIDLRMVTRSGELRYIPDRGQTNRANVADRDYFRAQSDDKSRGLFVGKPVIGRVTNKWGLPISVPVEKAGGDVAVLFAVIEFDRIVNTFEAQRVKPRGTIAIVRTDGTLLYRSPMGEATIGKPIASGSEWERFLGQSPKGTLMIEKSPVDDVSSMVSYSRSQDYPLVVLVTAGLDDMLLPWKFHIQVLPAVAGVISFFILGMAYILLRSMASEVGIKRELERLMLTDPLTGVGNRRFLTNHIEEEVLRAERYGRALTAVFFDLDHFKQVNDQFGHKVGDIVLIRVAQSLSASIRQSDYIGRFGGEEFVVLLTETGIEDGLMLVERMREAVGNLEIPELPQGITISAGLAQWKPGESAEALLQRSDRALYRAKAEGRNSSFVDLIP